MKVDNEDRAVSAGHSQCQKHVPAGAGRAVLEFKRKAECEPAGNALTGAARARIAITVVTRRATAHATVLALT